MSHPPSRPTDYPPSAYGPPSSGRTNGFAITSLVFGIIGGFPFGYVFGIIALGQIRQHRGSGRGLAVAGLVLSTLWLLGLLTFVTAVMATPRTYTPQISTGGSVSPTGLHVGDCVDGTDVDSAALSSLPRVPCTDPHGGEVFAVFDLPAGSYPGKLAAVLAIQPRCVSQLGAYSPTALQDPHIGLYLIFPLQQNWERGDHQAVCVVTQTGRTAGSRKGR